MAVAVRSIGNNGTIDLQNSHSIKLAENRNPHWPKRLKGLKRKQWWLKHGESYNQTVRNWKPGFTNPPLKKPRLVHLNYNVMKRKQTKSRAGKYKSRTWKRNFLGRLERASKSSSRSSTPKFKLKARKRHIGKNKQIYSTSATRNSFSQNSLSYQNKQKVGKIEKMSAKSFYTFVTQVQIASTTIGIQYVTTFGTRYSQTDINALYNFARKQDVITNVMPAIGADNSGAKIYLESWVDKYHLVNQGPTSIDLEIWDVVTKRTTSGTFNNAITDWSDGIGQMDMGATSNTSTPGCKPYQSKLFNINWWVMGVKKISMAPGARHDHVIKFKPRRYLDMHYFNNFTSVRGLYGESFMIVKGGIVDDSNAVTFAGNSAALGVSYSRVKIAGVRECEIVSKILMTSIRNISQSNALNVAAAATTDQFAQVAEIEILNAKTTTNYA